MNPIHLIVILSLALLLKTRRTMSQTQNPDHFMNRAKLTEQDSGSSNGTFYITQLFPEPVNIQMSAKTKLFEDRSQNGSQDAMAQHPHTVSLLIQGPHKSFRMCSGSLLSADWVMTSARCLGGCGRCAPTVYICAGLPVVRASYGARPEGAQCRRAVNAYVHPRFRRESKSGDYDVAIVKANGLFILNKFVRSIKLSIKNWTQKKLEKCALTGYEKGNDDYEINVQNVEVKKPCNDDFKLSTLLDEGDNARNETNEEQANGQNEEQEQDFKRESGLDRYMCTAPQKGPGLSTEMTGGGLVCAGELRGIASSMLWYTGNSKKPVEPFTCTKICEDVAKMTVFQDLCPHLRWINSLVSLFDSGDIPQECRGGAARRYRTATHRLYLCIVGLVLRFVW